MRKERIERDEETRDADLRPEYQFEYINPYDLPTGVYREGYRYHWGRHNVRGVNDHKLEKLLRAKWELVPASRSKDKFIDPLGENPLSEKYIYVKGCYLMERPEIYSKHEDQYHHKETLERTRSYEAQINDEGHMYNANSRRH